MKMKRFPIDAAGRRRAVQFENWDQEQLAHYAAWLEQSIKQADELLGELPTTQHYLLSHIRDGLIGALSETGRTV